MDVHLGMVSRPGTTVWGEILDLSEIDVRCDVTPEQADRIKIGQTVEVRQKNRNATSISGQVTMIGITVDAGTGLVAIVSRVPNAEAAL
jgi:multidrug efflux pump subunit AcrA (membrane-fusion protein)